MIILETFRAIILPTVSVDKLFVVICVFLSDIGSKYLNTAKCTNRGFPKHKTSAIMPILASEALLRENKKKSSLVCKNPD